MKKMKKMSKRIAVAVTVALLAFPLSTTLTLADTVTPSQTTTVATTDPVTTTTDETVPTTTADTTVPTTTDPATTTEDTTVPTTDPVTTTEDTTVPTTDLVTTTEDTTVPTTTVPATTPVVDANGNEVTPTNWFTDLIGKLQLVLTFDPARKAELTERHALAKLAEAQKLIIEGKTEAAENCLGEYTDKITKAQEFLDLVKDPTTAPAKNLVLAGANVNPNNIQVLSNLMDQLPPQAAQKLALNIVRIMEKSVTKMQKHEAKVTSVTTVEASETAEVAETSETAETPETSEASATPETSVTSATSATLATTAPTPNQKLVNDYKTMEKQAKIALKEFKKSLKQKKNIHLEDSDQQDDDDKNVVEQSKPEQEKPEMEQNSQQVTQSQTSQAKYDILSQPTHKTQTAPNIRTSEHGKEDRNKQEVHRSQKSGHKEDNHRDD